MVEVNPAFEGICRTAECEMGASALMHKIGFGHDND